MTLEEIFLLTNTISAIVATIFFLFLIIFSAFMAAKVEAIINKIGFLVNKSVIASEVAEAFVANLVSKFKKN